jgi:hypothetical protein
VDLTLRDRGDSGVSPCWSSNVENRLRLVIFESVYFTNVLHFSCLSNFLL